MRITLECGHTSMLRTRTTPEGYTHDWEVFVRGVDNADIHHYIEKGMFFPCADTFHDSIIDVLRTYLYIYLLSIFFLFVYI